MRIERGGKYPERGALGVATLPINVCAETDAWLLLQPKPPAIWAPGKKIKSYSVQSTMKTTSGIPGQMQLGGVVSHPGM